MAASAEIEEEGGEGYFASVSDLMVGVLFVFLLVLTVLALNFRDAEDEQTARLADLIAARQEVELQRQEAKRQEENALREAENARLKETENRSLRTLLEEAVAQLERDLESRQRLRVTMLQSLQDNLRERGVRVTVDTQSGVLRLSGDLLFETGQAAFRDQARDTVRVLAEVLGEVLPCYAAGAPTQTCPKPEPILETVLVEGHTDRQPYRGVTPALSQAKNDELSTQRALAVFQTIRQTQPRLDALRNTDSIPLLAVSGYGERRPLPGALGETAQDFERNRRIDVRFVLTSRTSDELERLRDQIRGVLEKSQ